MKIFNVGWRDLLKALFVAVFSAVLLAVYNLMTTCGFNCTGADWLEVLRLSIVAGLGYLIKNFFSDEEGKLGGKL